MNLVKKLCWWLHHEERSKVLTPSGGQGNDRPIPLQHLSPDRCRDLPKTDPDRIQRSGLGQAPDRGLDWFQDYCCLLRGSIFHGSTSKRTAPFSSRTRVFLPIILAILFASSEATFNDGAEVWRCHSINGFSSSMRNRPWLMRSVNRITPLRPGGGEEDDRLVDPRSPESSVALCRRLPVRGGLPLSGVDQRPWPLRADWSKTAILLPPEGSISTCCPPYQRTSSSTDRGPQDRLVGLPASHGVATSNSPKDPA